MRHACVYSRLIAAAGVGEKQLVKVAHLLLLHTYSVLEASPVELLNH